jgi:GNAT superfamily N-acetyltransferase
MAEAVTTHLLADVPDAIPQLAEWYKAEWSSWFDGTPLSEIEADLRSVALKDQSPFAIVALDAKAQPLGVCSVRNEVFEPYPHAGPWLRGLYVHGPYRGQGVAGLLIAAAVEHARLTGLAKLYAATHDAIGTFERAGWLGFDRVMHDQQALTIFATKVG